jgi:endonuclease YncB( thermonuclease family)
MVVASVWPAQAAGRRPSDVLDLAPVEATVTGVVDGNTITVAINGAAYTVRYIGMNAPATNQCYGAAARQANINLVSGQYVRLESDAVDTDANGALLRYVYLLDGRMANEELLAGGYARADAGTPNLKHQGDLNDLEQAARTARRGGWSACGWKSSVARAPGTCVTITAETFSSRAANVPEIDMLHEGDCVTLFKAANADGPEWSGQFIYHPAGTVLPLTDMYLRWKDGVIPLTVGSDGAAVAQVVRTTAVKTVGLRGRSFSRNVNVPNYVQVQALVRDPGQPQMWQIQNPRTWLLRDMGNGTYQVLIDAFVYKSGTMNAIYYGPNGYIP